MNTSLPSPGGDNAHFPSTVDRVASTARSSLQVNPHSLFYKRNKPFYTDTQNNTSCYMSGLVLQSE
eukprot:scaffold41263_cov32-Prasinocladus_malaysianus.AAC.1